jgi:bifunctional non-homologous end joining protein LigD
MFCNEPRLSARPAKRLKRRKKTMASANERIPFCVRPMLAALVPKPFHQPGWVYEEKYDGDRILAYREGRRVQLLSRNAKDKTAKFPNLATAIVKLRCGTLLLDGEVVLFDHKGVSRFQLLQQGKGEPVYAVFDCLYVNGKDLCGQPLSARRQALERAGLSGVLLCSHRLAENGLEAYKIARRWPRATRVRMLLALGHEAGGTSVVRQCSDV